MLGTGAARPPGCASVGHANGTPTPLWNVSDATIWSVPQSPVALHAPAVRHGVAHVDPHRVGAGEVPPGDVDLAVRADRRVARDVAAALVRRSRR